MDRRAAGALLALAACFACSAAAPTASNQTALDLYEDAPEGCYYNFQHYGEGDRIMTNEPCLNCTCHNRMLMCYLRVCPFTKPIGQDCTVEKRADQCCPIVTCPDVPVDLLTSTSTTSPAEYGATGIGKLDKYGCSISGKYFPEGSKVPPTPNKPCEHCYCIRNMTTCVMQECTLHVDGCTPIYHKDVCCPVRYSCDHPEDELPLLDDMSTTVRPTPGFLLTTTTIAPVTQMTQDCVHDDRVFSDGALIKTEKACEHCYCMKGDIVCVVQECGAPMENEGKNCSSLPPREGQCCPDTYICEGDELPTDLPTESITEKLTTLSPPRRTSVEGSGYRNEPDEVPYTDMPIIQPEVEGSGDDEEASKPLGPDGIIPTPGDDDQYIYVTTKGPAYDEHEKTTVAIDEIVIPEMKDKTVEPAVSTNAPISEEVQKLTTEEDILEPHKDVPATIASETYESATTEPGDLQNTVPDVIPDEEITKPHGTTHGPTSESVAQTPSDGEDRKPTMSQDEQYVTSSPTSKPEYSATSSSTSEEIEKETATPSDISNITPEVTSAQEYSDDHIRRTTSATSADETPVEENKTTSKPEEFAPGSTSSPTEEDKESSKPEEFAPASTSSPGEEDKESSKPDEFAPDSTSSPDVEDTGSSKPEEFAPASTSSPDEEDKESSKPEEFAPASTSSPAEEDKESSKPEEFAPASTSSLAEEDKESSKPEEFAPGSTISPAEEDKESSKPEEFAPASTSSPAEEDKESSKPEEFAPAFTSSPAEEDKESSKPEEFPPGSTSTPAVEDKESSKPEEFSPASTSSPGQEDKESSKPDEFAIDSTSSPAEEDKESSKPEEFVPGSTSSPAEEDKERSKPEEFASGSTSSPVDEDKETSKPHELAPGSTSTPAEESSKPEEYAPGTTNKPAEEDKESSKPEEIGPITTSSPLEKEEKTTEPDHAQNTVAVAEEDSTHPHSHLSPTTVSSAVEDESTSGSHLGQDVVTDKIIKEDVPELLEHITTVVPAVKDTEFTTAEPDRGLNTIPNELHEETSSEPSLPGVTTFTEETKGTEFETDENRRSTSSVSELTTLLPEGIATKSDQFTVTTEPSFRKEDEGIVSTEKTKEHELTTVKPEFVDEGLIPTSSHDDKTDTSSDVPSAEEEFTTSIPEYITVIAETTGPKQITTESPNETSAVTEILPEKVSEPSSEQDSDLPSSTEKLAENTPLVETHEEPSRIPGEGDCLLNGVTYRNNTIVPSTNNCHTGCKCVSSIIKCDPIICSPPPDYMDNCQSIYDSPDSCCPTFVCDHPRETVPPQSDNQMSGTESPIPSPTIECRGDQCEISEPTKQPIEPIGSCTSGDCLIDDHKAETECGAEGCGGVPQKPHTSIPTVEHAEECSDGKCKPENCANGECQLPHGQLSPDTHCEGEHCGKTGEVVSESPQQCKNGEDCKSVEIPTIEAAPCEGESCNKVDCGDGGCGFDVIASPPDHQIESCKEEDGCKPQDIPITECTGDGPCRRKEVPTSDTKLPTCEGPNCISQKETTVAQSVTDLSSELPKTEETPSEEATEKTIPSEGETVTELPDDHISKPVNENIPVKDTPEMDTYTTEGQTSAAVTIPEIQKEKPVIEGEATKKPTTNEDKEIEMPATVDKEDKEKPVLEDEITKKPTMIEQEGTETPGVIEEETTKHAMLSEDEKEKPLIDEATKIPIIDEDKGTEVPSLIDEEGTEKPGDTEIEGTVPPTIDIEDGPKEPAIIDEDDNEKPVISEETTKEPAIVDKDDNEMPITDKETTKEPAIVDDEGKEKPEVDEESTTQPALTDEDDKEKPGIEEDTTKEPTIVDEEGKEKPMVDEESTVKPAIIDEDDKEKPIIDEETTKEPAIVDEEGKDKPVVDEESMKKPAITDDDKEKPVIDEETTKQPAIIDEEGKEKPTIHEESTTEPAIVDKDGKEKPMVDEESTKEPAITGDDNGEKPVFAEDITKKPDEGEEGTTIQVFTEKSTDVPAIKDKATTDKPVVADMPTAKPSLIDGGSKDKPMDIEKDKPSIIEDGTKGPILVDEEVKPTDMDMKDTDKPGQEPIEEFGSEKPDFGDNEVTDKPPVEVEATENPDVIKEETTAKVVVTDEDKKEKPSYNQDEASEKPTDVEEKGTEQPTVVTEDTDKKPTIAEEDKEKLDISGEQDTEKSTAVDKESTEKTLVDQNGEKEPVVVDQESTEKSIAPNLEHKDKPIDAMGSTVIPGSVDENKASEKPEIYEGIEEPAIVEKDTEKPDIIDDKEKPTVDDVESTKKPVDIERQGTELPVSVGEETTKKPDMIDEEGKKPVTEEDTMKPFTIEQESTGVPYTIKEESTAKPAIIDESTEEPTIIEKEDSMKPEKPGTELPAFDGEEATEKPAIIDEDIKTKPDLTDEESTETPAIVKEGTEKPGVSVDHTEHTIFEIKGTNRPYRPPTVQTDKETDDAKKPVVDIDEDRWIWPNEEVTEKSTDNEVLSTEEPKTHEVEMPGTKVPEALHTSESEDEVKSPEITVQPTETTLKEIEKTTKKPYSQSQATVTEQDGYSKEPMIPEITTESMLEQEITTKTSVPDHEKVTVSEQDIEVTTVKVDATVMKEEASTIGQDLITEEQALTTQAPESHKTSESVEKTTEAGSISEQEEVTTGTSDTEPQEVIEPELQITRKSEDESTTKLYEEEKIKPTPESHVTETSSPLPSDGATDVSEITDEHEPQPELPVQESDEKTTQIPLVEIKTDHTVIQTSVKDETITVSPDYSVTEPVREFTKIEYPSVTGQEDIATEYPHKQTPEPEKEKPTEKFESPATEIPIPIITETEQTSDIPEKDVTTYEEKATIVPDVSDHKDKTTTPPEGDIKQQEPSTDIPEHHVTVMEDANQTTGPYTIEPHITEPQETSTKSGEQEVKDSQAIATDIPITSDKEGESKTTAPELIHTEPHDLDKKEPSITDDISTALPIEDVHTELPGIQTSSEVPQSLVTEQKEGLGEQTTVSGIPKEEPTYKPELLTTQSEEISKAPEPHVPGQEENQTEAPILITESVDVSTKEPEQDHKITPVFEDTITDTASTLQESPAVTEEIEQIEVMKSTEHTAQTEFSETTPYLIELEEHTHKTLEDLTTVSPSEEEHSYKPVEGVSTSSPSSEHSHKPVDDISTSSPSKEEYSHKPMDDITTSSPSAEEYTPTIEDHASTVSPLDEKPFTVQSETGEEVAELATKKTDEEIETATKSSEEPDEVSEKVSESVPAEETTPAVVQGEDTKYPADHKDHTTATPTQITEESTPVLDRESEKLPTSESDIAVPTEKEMSTSEKPKPSHPILEHETTALAEETTAKVTTRRVGEDVVTPVPDDKFIKPEEKPTETSEVHPSSTTTEVSKPSISDMQPTDEIPVPDEDGQIPPSGTSGYGEPDYVEEDQAFGPGTCRYGGKVYVSAQQIPRDDPCDFCFCFRSDIICLQQSCPPPIHGCHEEPIQGFCCPRYECPVSMATTVNVTTTTTTTTTTLPPHFPTHSYKGAAQRRGCQIKGHTYKVGEVVRSSSGPCLHCTCGGDGQMKCDPKACTPEPMLRQMIAAAVSAKRRR